MEVVFFTHKGLQRPHNEDAILVFDQLYSEVDFLSPKSLEIFSEEGIAIVSDGMGGHSKGELASFLVLDYFRGQQILNEKELHNLLHKAKSVLNQYVKSHPEAYQLATVIAGIMVLKDKFIVFNVGDSRVYEIENGIIKRITKDHSYVEILYQRGQIRYKDMRNHPRKNIVTSCICGDETDTISEIFVKTVERNRNLKYQFLICSDGLWEMLSDEEMQQCFWNYKSLIDIANCLKYSAFERGATDNISFVILTV